MPKKKELQMKTLNGVKIAVGVTGCIAAYKSAEVVSRLIKKGADYSSTPFYKRTLSNVFA